jgi:hypothetical protein
MVFDCAASSTRTNRLDSTHQTWRASTISNKAAGNTRSGIAASGRAQPLEGGSADERNVTAVAEQTKSPSNTSAAGRWVTSKTVPGCDGDESGGDAGEMWAWMVILTGREMGSTDE